MMKLHSNLSQDKRMKTHKCTICDQEFKPKSDLNKHFDEIHENKQEKTNVILYLWKKHSFSNGNFQLI